MLPRLVVEEEGSAGRRRLVSACLIGPAVCVAQDRPMVHPAGVIVRVLRRGQLSLPVAAVLAAVVPPKAIRGSMAPQQRLLSAPHKDFSELYGEMSGKGASASEAHPGSEDRKHSTATAISGRSRCILIPAAQAAPQLLVHSSN
eukprot:COSAG03_NODE_735_length_6040_cov_59.467598_6_plen_144_part_00